MTVPESVTPQVSRNISEAVVATLLGVGLAAIPTWLIAHNRSVEMAVGTEYD